jgi:hypothetical protein
MQNRAVWKRMSGCAESTRREDHASYGVDAPFPTSALSAVRKIADVADADECGGVVNVAVLWNAAT